MTRLKLAEMKLVTIKESHYTSDLLVIKSRLESEGIRCTIKDEHSAEILSHLPTLAAKLQVYRKDLPLVKKVLADVNNLDFEEVIVCPICKSDEVTLKLSNSQKFKLIVDLVKSLNIFKNNDHNVLRNKYHNYYCKNCGNKFLV